MTLLTLLKSYLILKVEKLDFKNAQKHTQQFLIF